MVKKAITKTVKKTTAKTKVKPDKPNISPPATKTKRAIPAAVAPIAAGTAVVAAGIAGANKNKEGKTFDDAFRKARAKGEGTKFTFNGKSYVAVTKDDLKKKGYGTDTAGLRAYNRAGGKAVPKIDVKAAAKKIADAVNKNKPPKATQTKATPLTRKQKRQQRRKERIGFETFKERRQARRAARKEKKKDQFGTTGLGGTTRKVSGMKSGGVVSARRSKPRGVGAAKRGFGRALKR
jgi:hypothetical protein